MFDLKDIELQDTGVMEVELPNGNPLVVEGVPVTIEFHGIGSKEHTRAKYKFENAVQAKSIAMVRGKTSKNAAEENAELKANFVAECTIKINGLPNVTPLELFKNPKLVYILDQAEQFISKAENFM